MPEPSRGSRFAAVFLDAPTPPAPQNACSCHPARSRIRGRTGFGRSGRGPQIVRYKRGRPVVRSNLVMLMFHFRSTWFGHTPEHSCCTCGFTLSQVKLSHNQHLQYHHLNQSSGTETLFVLMQNYWCFLSKYFPPPCPFGQYLLQGVLMHK